MDEPEDAGARRAVAPVVCYPVEALPEPGVSRFDAARSGEVARVVTVPPRDSRAVRVPAGGVLRIVSVEGPQVGDLNLFAAADPAERFYSGKTRALHGSHVGLGDRLWSCFPHLRPMATVIEDSLGWYGIDAHGGSVHDVIGTRCDPYTHNLLSGGQYHHCCHSNLTRALAEETGMPLREAEALVHDVVNVFMCTGFTRETGEYFMKASPVRPGDVFGIGAEIDLIAVLSACPGGDCGAEHSSDVAACHPLRMEVFDAVGDWVEPERNGYDGTHGVPA